MTLQERLRGYNPPDRTIDSQRQIAVDIHEAADALDAKDVRIKELERIVYLFVEADDDRDAGSITDAEYKARIMDWTNRAREALK